MLPNEFMSPRHITVRRTVDNLDQGTRYFHTMSLNPTPWELVPCATAYPAKRNRDA